MNVTSRADLPENYREIWHLDLLNNKKDLILVNGIGVVLMVLLLIAGNWMVPKEVLF